MHFTFFNLLLTMLILTDRGHRIVVLISRVYNFLVDACFLLALFWNQTRYDDVIELAIMVVVDEF